MEPSDIQSLGRILRALVGGQEEPLWKRDEIAIDKSPDMIDQGQSATERELALQRLERNQRRLQEARAALQRIDRSPRRNARIYILPFCVRTWWIVKEVKR